MEIVKWYVHVASGIYYDYDTRMVRLFPACRVYDYNQIGAYRYYYSLAVF